MSDDLNAFSDETSEEELENGTYKVNGQISLWYDGEWFTESPNNPGHRDGTFAVGGPGLDPDINWRPIKNKSYLLIISDKELIVFIKFKFLFQRLL